MLVVIRRTNFPPVRAEGVPDFTSRRRRVLRITALIGTSRNFVKKVVVYI
jgi:hypothetical protein